VLGCVLGIKLEKRDAHLPDVVECLQVSYADLQANARKISTLSFSDKRFS
jgi:hypothetical protein